MRSSFFAIAILAGLTAACGTDTPASDDVAAAVETEIPFVNDENAGPVFVGVEGGNIAVSGYDAVSYFEGEGTPVKGSAEHKVFYNGTEYHFASAENAEKFEADPVKFVPQYGGHCAWAMARGSLAPGDATKYKIVDGKLYLNFNQDVQDKWLKDVPGFIEKSEKEWPKIPADAKFGG